MTRPPAPFQPDVLPETLEFTATRIDDTAVLDLVIEAPCTDASAQFGLSAWHLILLFVVVLLDFGAAGLQRSGRAPAARPYPQTRNQVLRRETKQTGSVGDRSES